MKRLVLVVAFAILALSSPVTLFADERPLDLQELIDSLPPSASLTARIDDEVARILPGFVPCFPWEKDDDEFRRIYSDKPAGYLRKDPAYAVVSVDSEGAILLHTLTSVITLPE